MKLLTIDEYMQLNNLVYEPVKDYDQYIEFFNLHSYDSDYKLMRYKKYLSAKDKEWFSITSAYVEYQNENMFSYRTINGKTLKLKNKIPKSDLK